MVPLSVVLVLSQGCGLVGGRRAGEQESLNLCEVLQESSPGLSLPFGNDENSSGARSLNWYLRWCARKGLESVERCDEVDGRAGEIFHQ